MYQLKERQKNPKLKIKQLSPGNQIQERFIIHRMAS